MRLSRHAKKRMAERMQGSGRRKRAEQALQYGLTREAAFGVIFDYLDARVSRDCTIQPRIFRGMVYIFRERFLITVYDVPPPLRADARDQERTARERSASPITASGG